MTVTPAHSEKLLTCGVFIWWVVTIFFVTKYFACLAEDGMFRVCPYAGIPMTTLVGTKQSECVYEGEDEYVKKLASE